MVTDAGATSEETAGAACVLIAECAAQHCHVVATSCPTARRST